MPKNPAIAGFLMTYVEYGSCNYCDILQRIQYLEDCENIHKLPTEQQVKDYMILCKDIVSNIIRPYNIGWRGDEQFEQVIW